MSESVEQRVIRVFADFKKVSPEDISIDTTFEELGFDSLDGLNLIFELEEEFDLMIPDTEVTEMKSVRQAVEGIKKLLAAREQGIDVNAAAIEEFKAQQAGVVKKSDEKPVETPDEPKGESPAKAKEEAQAEANIETSPQPEAKKKPKTTRKPKTEKK